MTVERTIGGLRVFVVPTWATGYAWRDLRPGRCPPRGKRKGTRKMWKRVHPCGLRWRIGPVEPDGILKTADAIYCTARQHAALLTALASKEAPNG